MKCFQKDRFQNMKNMKWLKSEQFMFITTFKNTHVSNFDKRQFVRFFFKSATDDVHAQSFSHFR